MRSSSAGLWVKRTAANSGVRSQKEMTAHLRFPFRRLRAGYSRWRRVCVVGLPEEPFVLTAPSRQPEGSCAAGRRSGAGRSSPREFPCRLRPEPGNHGGARLHSPILEEQTGVGGEAPLHPQSSLRLERAKDRLERAKNRQGWGAEPPPPKVLFDLSVRKFFLICP